MSNNLPIIIDTETIKNLLFLNKENQFEFTNHADLSADFLSKTFGIAFVPKVFDMVKPMITSLSEDLIPGSEIRSEFENECLQSSDNIFFGHWYYYPEQNHLVRFGPKKWHQLSLITRNSALLYPKNECFNWKLSRNIFEQLTISVAGASVGSGILHTSIMLLRPKAVKIADPKFYNLNNANRVPLTHVDIGKNKTTVCAEKINSLDPYISTYLYPEGIKKDNIDQFIFGNTSNTNNTKTEPASNIVVEETDNPSVKVLLRQKAKEARVPLVMVTDIGSAVQVDVRRFDLNPNESLSVGVSDETLIEKLNDWEADKTNRQKFTEIAFALSGKESIIKVNDFKKTIFNEYKNDFTGIPQLGSAANTGAGIAALIIARIALGFTVPERIFFDPIEKH